MIPDLIKAMRAVIAKHDWQCISVGPCEGDGGDTFAYTVGLKHSFDHPELIMFGLAPRLMHGIFTDCVEIIRESGSLPVDEPIPDILGSGYTVVLKTTDPQKFSEYFAMAVNFYGGLSFPALVLFWPDKDHQFPWNSSEPMGQDAALALIRRSAH